MDIFNVLSLLGGLAMFLYGMNVMGDGLAKTAGGKLEKILEKLTSTPIKGVLLGAAVTGVIQSSSATTVMVVGLVNSGIMKLRQAVGIIMGANIGTTVTSWILSLTGIQSDNIFINMLKPSSFSPILAVIGIIFLMFTKSEKKHDIGGILLGFTVLMFGMEMMSGAVEPLNEYTHHVLQSIPWNACGNAHNSHHTELFGVCRYTPGAVCNRGCIIWDGDPYHHGSEHRNLCNGTDIMYRNQEECQESCVCASVLQHHRNSRVHGGVLHGQFICTLPVPE